MVSKDWTVAQRLDWVRKQKGLTYNDVAILIEESNANALGVAFRRNTLKIAYVYKIINKLNLNQDWVFNGEGDPYKETISTLVMEEPESYLQLKDKYEELQKLYAEASLELKHWKDLANVVQKNK